MRMNDTATQRNSCHGCIFVGIQRVSVDREKVPGLTKICQDANVCEGEEY